jgi:glycosyltransferase involved in cell wall biosynthesis
MRTAVVAVAPGGLPPGGFALSFATSLARSGRRCTLIWVSPGDPVVEARSIESRAGPVPASVDGLEVLYLKPTPPTVRRFPDFPLFHLSHEIAPVLQQFDIIYSLLLGHPAMQAVRLRRFSPSRAPFFVTIAEQTMKRTLLEQRRFSADPVEWNQIFGERYQAKHSDTVICLDPLDAEHLRERAWELAGGSLPQLMTRDPANWPRLHEEMEAAAQAAGLAPKPVRVAATDPAVTVCMAYFNHGRYLSDALEGLAQQTTPCFTVLVVDDGSTSADSRRAFDLMRERYRERGWRFLSRPRAGAAAARNFAAREARSEYVLFFDADDISPPNLVSRLLEAAEYSGDDVVTAWQYKFLDSEAAYDFNERRLLAPPYLVYTPPGNDPAGNLLNNMHGGVVFLARRSVFLAVDGFPEAWGSCQDYAFHMRIAVAGYANDIVPEFLCYNRNTPGSVSKTIPSFSNQEAIRCAVAERLDPIGLSQLAFAFHALADEAIRPPERD